MIVYAAAKGYDMGLLDDSWLVFIQESFQGLLDHMTTEDEAGLHVHGICIGTSAGSYDYYVGRPTSEDDLHGVGAFLLAAMAVYEYLED